MYLIDERLVVVLADLDLEPVVFLLEILNDLVKLLEFGSNASEPT